MHTDSVHLMQETVGPDGDCVNVYVICGDCAEYQLPRRNAIELQATAEELQGHYCASCNAEFTATGWRYSMTDAVIAAYEALSDDYPSPETIADAVHRRYGGPILDRATVEFILVSHWKQATI